MREVEVGEPDLAGQSNRHNLSMSAKPRGSQSLGKKMEAYLQAILAWMLRILLSKFLGLQDAFLAISPIRRLVAYALMPRCWATISARLQKPSNDE